MDEIKNIHSARSALAKNLSKIINDSPSKCSKKSPSKTEKSDKFDENLSSPKTKSSDKFENLTETNIIQDTPESKRPSRNKKAVERMGIDDIKISDTISPNKSKFKLTPSSKHSHSVEENLGTVEEI